MDNIKIDLGDIEDGGIKRIVVAHDRELVDSL
jgi:hypothetical protein